MLLKMILKPPLLKEEAELKERKRKVSDGGQSLKTQDKMKARAK